MLIREYYLWYYSGKYVKKEYRDNFMDFVRKLEDEGKTGSYIARFKVV